MFHALMRAYFLRNLSASLYDRKDPDLKAKPPHPEMVFPR